MQSAVIYTIKQKTEIFTVNRRKVISIIMGGGRGTRLYPLTKSRCKPAVPLAGKYRLVDIPISNCVNSGLDRIYLLSQFNTASLHKHIQQSYKFDAFGGGFVDILAAEQTEAGGHWYQGTADAVRKNMHHFERHGDNALFLILSGDQLYQMDFRSMIAQHEESGADVTIAAKPMPKSVVDDLGVMRVDEHLRIQEFAEKPKDPKVIDSLVVGPKIKERLKDQSQDYCLASMGIYIFNASVMEEAMRGSEMDFGKEIIPNMLKSKKLCAHIFDGYWEDIGTIASFFEANLSLTDDIPPYNFYNENHVVYTHARFLPGVKVQNSKIERCNLSDGSIIQDADLKRCIIGVRSMIRSGTKLRNVVMMGADFFETDAEKELCHKDGRPKIGIGKNCEITNAILDKNSRIGNNVRLSPEGKPDGWEAEGLHVRDGILIVHKSAVIPDNTVI